MRIHDRQGIKHLLQLRVGLSPLRHNKTTYNFLNTPDDWCDCLCAPEDTKYFLLHCHLYILPRQKLNTSITDILAADQLHHLIDYINLYLYGHTTRSGFMNTSTYLYPQ